MKEKNIMGIFTILNFCLSSTTSSSIQNLIILIESFIFDVVL